ncbi:MAG TPA: transglutaminase domain-containing protein, partial [Vicinamibacterales bacterium]|nr:transglutaminase domain-containing protein [Vicinamibacterales bacterium]
SKVPAYREEPYSRPEWARKPWMLIFYSLGTETLGDKFWKQYSKVLHDAYARRVKPNDEMRRVAAAAVASAATEDERAAALLRIIHERVKRVDVDTADPADWRKAKDNKNAGDVLKRGVGTAEDVVLLFVALASAAGLDARVAAAPDRATTVINQSYGHPFFFSDRIAAIRSGGGWKFYDPANEYSADGKLRWRYELQKVFVADPKDTLLVDVPLAPAEASAKRRTATLRLLEDGTLEGQCQVTYTGHWDESVKEQDDQDTPSEREKNYREHLLKRWAGAEITGLEIENATDPQKPYTASFHVKLAGYAQRTGSRLVFQPAVFQRGVEPLFTSGERKGDVYFPFPWSEHDQVTIELPPGFELEEPEAPSALKSNAARYVMALKLSAGPTRKLVMNRDFAFGLEESILFRPEHYRALKQLFDFVHTQDAHSLVLRRTSK